MGKDWKRAVIIIPFYNEETRILKSEFSEAFAIHSSVDFCLVDDGSSDSTPLILDAFASTFQNVLVLKLKENRGKAEAIRQAVLNVEVSIYHYIAYLDADLSTPFSELLRMLDYISTNQYITIVMGTRIKLLGNNVHRSLFRHYFGRIFATIISQFILKIPVYDTQCGAKIIDATLAKELFEQPFKTKWLFDIELLLRYKAIDSNFQNKVVEIPLNIWIERGKSKIKFYEFILFPAQIIRLFFQY